MEEYNPNNSVESSLFNQSMNQSINQPASSNDSKNENTEIEQIASIITDLDRRLRTLEERYSNIRKKLQLTDQNMIETERSFTKDLRSLNDDTLKLKKQVVEYSEKIELFNDELSQAAKKTDIKIIEKYLALWNPQNFVTRTEIKQYLKQKESIKESIPKIINDEDLNN